MLSCEEFYDLLTHRGIDFFTGVPDSLLIDFNAYIMDNSASTSHIIAANEGGAVALAAGYHLATGKIGLVYMQNSGLGNAVNPLTSLVDIEVYSIPVLLLIGWRGEPGKEDEPQHIKQGKITLSILDTLGIPYEVLPSFIGDTKKSIERALAYMKDKSGPFAFVVRKDTFEKYELKNKEETHYKLVREDAIRAIMSLVGNRDIIVSTTGMASRELFECREQSNKDHSKDFLTVGSMGHSSMIALGIAESLPDRQVFCLDGDGSLIMHMGTIAIIGSLAPENFRHVIINNGAHDSVGGQPTAGFCINIPKLAISCGYKNAYTALTNDEIRKGFSLMKVEKGPSLLEIRVNKGYRKNLGRPTTTPKENKKAFMKFLSK